MTDTYRQSSTKRTSKKSVNGRGRAPATPKQKAAARASILARQPWQKSTGPISLEGKAIASFNAVKASWKHSIKASDLDFDQQVAECDRILAELHQMAQQQALEIESSVTDTRDAAGGLLVRHYTARVIRMDPHKWQQLQAARAKAREDEAWQRAFYGLPEPG